MKGKLDLENYEWIMLKTKTTYEDDGKLVLFIPKGSKIPLKHFAMLSNLSVERVDDEGVWMVVR